MKAFNFRLEKLLDLKRNDLKERVKELQEIQQNIHLKELELEKVRKSLNESVDITKEQARNIQQILSFKTQLLDCEVSLLDQIEFLQYQEESKKDEVRKIRNEEKAYEKLKDKELKRYLYQFNKLEQKEMDEIAQRRFLNK